MSGIVGGDLSGNTLAEMLEGVVSSDESTQQFERRGAGLALASHSIDRDGAATWDDGDRMGAVYGAISNLGELDRSLPELFDRFLDQPADTATRLEGDFLIAAYDAGERRFVLATDKLGARPCYYTQRGPFGFATAVDVLLPLVSDPTLDLQAVSDMLLMGHMWGDHTLVEEIRAVRPATVMEVQDGTRRTTRYWKPGYEEHEPGEAYLSELVRRYRQAARRTTTTLPETAGVWLSGGLDSRTTMAALVEADPARNTAIRAYTYDANPPTSDNPRIASEVAGRLGVELEEVPLTAETFANHFEQVIEATDGMIRWNTVVNLSPSYDLQPRPGAMMEGMQGALLGDHLLRPHLTDYRSAVESQYASEAGTDVELVERILEPDVDPMGTFKAEVNRTAETDVRRQVLDIHFQNYYTRHSSTSNRVMHDRFGSRVPHADGDYLEWTARLPSAYRKGAFPFTDTKVPYGTSRAKLELCRRIDPALADITYERTKVRPSRPYPVHVAGFVSNVVVSRLQSKATYGAGQLADFWLRDTDTRLHRTVKGLVSDAGSRELFNADVVAELFDDQLNGSNNVPVLAQITTLEYWLQQHLD